MKHEKLIQLAVFFLNLENSMQEKGRPNIAAYARKKHEHYYQQYLAKV